MPRKHTNAQKLREALAVYEGASKDLDEALRPFKPAMPESLPADGKAAAARRVLALVDAGGHEYKPGPLWQGTTQPALQVP